MDKVETMDLVINNGSRLFKLIIINILSIIQQHWVLILTHLEIQHLAGRLLQ